MIELPTPETDAFAVKFKSLCGNKEWVPVDFSRRLERERDEAREALADWENAASHVEADHPDEKHCGCVPVLRKLLADSKRERDEAREELAEAKREAENLAKSIYRSEYSDNDTDWELLDSVAGVISQIDNMYAGVREQRDEARAEWGKASMDAAQLLSEKTKVIAERDEAREKIKRQAERIRELEGATNHAGGMKKIESIKYHGTDETDAMVELWESCHLPADFARRMEAERILKEAK